MQEHGDALGDVVQVECTLLAQVGLGERRRQDSHGSRGRQVQNVGEVMEAGPE